ncbi:MAG: tyrosine--tRNA ligase [Robiginitomaculum sp.]|nr:MAG: tyrosine--tRNA ligase [Robiginitomaculum sp.]
MDQYKSEFVRSLVSRGYHYQATDLEGIDRAAQKSGLNAYIGFDCTAPSLHVGSLVQIMLLRRLQQAGGRPIVLLGGGTTKIGDPSDKDKSRPVLTEEQITANKDSLKGVFSKFLKFGDGPTDAIMVDNADWLEGLGYIEFLRDYGRFFSINRMIALESVKRRLDREQEMTFLEFNYMLLQAYDFLELNQRYGCRLQMGGSDQWGNIVNGRELIHKYKVEQTGEEPEAEKAFGFTAPLITTASGTKMGKTANGAVWLNADQRSPYEYWQFWRNCEDADVARFMRLFTDFPLGEIAKYEALEGADINSAKIVLANACTTLLHGENAAKSAQETAHATFAKGQAGGDLPKVQLSAEEMRDGVSLIALFKRAGLVVSRGEAKRHIKAGALKLNDQAVTDMQASISAGDFSGQDSLKLSVGKKKHALLLPAA